MIKTYFVNFFSWLFLVLSALFPLRNAVVVAFSQFHSIKINVVFGIGTRKSDVLLCMCMAKTVDEAQWPNNWRLMNVLRYRVQAIQCEINSCKPIELIALCPFGLHFMQ